MGEIPNIQGFWYFTLFHILIEYSFRNTPSPRPLVPFALIMSLARVFPKRTQKHIDDFPRLDTRDILHTIHIMCVSVSPQQLWTGLRKMLTATLRHHMHDSPRPTNPWKRRNIFNVFLKYYFILQLIARFLSFFFLSSLAFLMTPDLKTCIMLFLRLEVLLMKS